MGTPGANHRSTHPKEFEKREESVNKKWNQRTSKATLVLEKRANAHIKREN